METNVAVPGPRKMRVDLPVTDATSGMVYFDNRKRGVIKSIEWPNGARYNRTQVVFRVQFGEIERTLRHETIGTFETEV